MPFKYDLNFFKKKAKESTKIDNVDFPEHSNVARKLDDICRKHHGCTELEAALESILDEEDE